MASARLRRVENVAGDFFVDATCIDCDLCRQVAPHTFRDDAGQSAVYAQPRGAAEELAALKALVTCPTASIGAPGHNARAAVAAFPDRIDGPVSFCGFASEKSFGASSYLVLRPEGNVLVDSPRFTRPLADRIEALGGVRLLFLTHRDDVADHARWAERFSADRVVHARDVVRGLEGAERQLEGDDAIALAEDLLAVPTPGHTRGHTALLFGGRYLFTGDHLWWSDELGSLEASREVCWYSWREQTRSMERLLDLSFEWVLPGHGRRAHASRAGMRRHLEACLARMRAGR